MERILFLFSDIFPPIVHSKSFDAIGTAFKDSSKPAFLIDPIFTYGSLIPAEPATTLA